MFDRIKKIFPFFQKQEIGQLRSELQMKDFDLVKVWKL